MRTVCSIGHLVCLLAALAVFWGCAVVPVDYYDDASRRNISHETPSLLRSGITAKEEVFLLLGEPDYVSQDGQQLGYIWGKVKWVYGDITGG